jgi:hypothetical protein
MFGILFDTTLFGTSFPLADKILQERLVSMYNIVLVSTFKFALVLFVTETISMHLFQLSCSSSDVIVGVTAPRSTEKDTTTRM